MIRAKLNYSKESFEDYKTDEKKKINEKYDKKNINSLLFLLIGIIVLFFDRAHSLAFYLTIIITIFCFIYYIWQLNLSLNEDNKLLEDINKYYSKVSNKTVIIYFSDKGLLLTLNNDSVVDESQLISWDYFEYYKTNGNYYLIFPTLLENEYIFVSSDLFDNFRSYKSLVGLTRQKLPISI